MLSQAEMGTTNKTLVGPAIDGVEVSANRKDCATHYLSSQMSVLLCSHEVCLDIVHVVTFTGNAFLQKQQALYLRLSHSL